MSSQLQPQLVQSQPTAPNIRLQLWIEGRTENGAATYWFIIRSSQRDFTGQREVGRCTLATGTPRSEYDQVLSEGRAALDSRTITSLIPPEQRQ